MVPLQRSRPLRVVVLVLTMLAVLTSPASQRRLLAAWPYPDEATGNDISWPQCHGAYPATGRSVAIVGLNDGEPYTANPCLTGPGGEWAWAQTSPNPPSIYLNVDYYPSIDDPHAQAGPYRSAPCGTNVDCAAYNWGWNAALDAVTRVHNAGLSPAMWWLDVETHEQHWPCDAMGTTCDTARDAEMLGAMIGGLRSQRLVVGIYSTSHQFGLLMGGMQPGLPTWVPDFDDSNPIGYCTPAHSFGGGDVFIVQFTDGSFDGDLSCPARHGYDLAGGDGGVFTFGDAGGYGSTGGRQLNQPIVGVAAPPRGAGYWLVAGDGGVFPFGPGACGCGSTGGMHLNQPIVGMAPTPDGHGYWLVARDGGIFPFGDAAGRGSLGNLHLNQPIVAMAPTADGGGYWLVASDGGVFPFGDACGCGSLGSVHLNAPVVGVAASASGHGYWLVAADGGIFPFGDAAGYGSAGAMHLDSAVVGMARTLTGLGYWLVTGAGTVIAFGDAVAQYYGSWAPRPLNRPILGITATA